MSSGSRSARGIFAAAALAACSLRSADAQATIQGHVRSQRTGEPIGGATVLIVATRNGAVTDSSGGYVIRHVLAGASQGRARAVGFAGGGGGGCISGHSS